ncbi:MAG: YifB family Mg chelatase-like AAA ATPase [Planctomycetota bacterium]
MRRFTRTTGATLFGACARLVDVEVALSGSAGEGPRAFRIIGLPDSALREGRDRVRGAIFHARWPWPGADVTVNLAPAAARKEGAALDLPIALAILGAQEVMGPDVRLGDLICLGELGLDGTVRPVRGVLAAVEAARARGLHRAIVAHANAFEAAAVRGMHVHAVRTLVEAVGYLGGGAEHPAVTPRPWRPASPSLDAVRAIRGQATALRAAAIAAVGGHNLLVWGSPGTGKTLVARALIELMPPLEYEEALEVSRIHSAAGLLAEGLVARRPFRAPHHTTSLAGLVGGGRIPRPGEMSLAHLGVLFLDEVPEFPRSTLEALRQPIEDGGLVIGRAAGRARFPTEVLLVAAMNPCPCGWRGVGDRCRCTQRDVARYQARISGPLRDRFDLQVEMGPVKAEDLVSDATEALAPELEPERRKQARKAQIERARRYGFDRPSNARIPARLLPRAVEIDAEAERAFVVKARAIGLTGRGMHRVMRVARTIADLNGSAAVTTDHLHGAIAFRGA